MDAAAVLAAHFNSLVYIPLCAGVKEASCDAWSGSIVWEEPAGEGGGRAASSCRLAAEFGGC